MRKRDPVIFDVHKDAELEAIAKAYVQAASKREMTMTEASKIIAQIWREDITEPKKAEKLILMPLHETEEQKTFRAKVEKLVDEYPEFIHHIGIPNPAERRQYTIEIICAIHKVFLEKDRIQSSTLLYYIRDYFKQIFKNEKYSNTTTIYYFKEHIFQVIESLVFNTTKLSGPGCLRNVDVSSRPVIQQSTPSVSSPLRNISYLEEPYLKGKEYNIRKSKTSTAIIQLVWFVETFF